jgi:homoserine O-acetyltransferase
MSSPPAPARRVLRAQRAAPPEADADQERAMTLLETPGPETATHVPRSAGSADGARALRIDRRASEIVRITPKHVGRAVDVALHYRWHGTVGAPTVIVQGGISAGRDAIAAEPGGAHGWWEDFVGPGRAIDPAHWRVLSVDWFTADAFGADAPVSSEDQADAIAALADALGSGRVHAFVGSSYGAMVGLAFAARHPHRLRRLCAIAGAHRPHPLATAWRAVQRGIVRLGLESGDPATALALARQLAMTTYRGRDEFAQRFAAPPQLRHGRFRFAVEDYLDRCGRRFAESFDPRRFLELSESIDLHDVEPERIATPTTLIGFPSDRLVPLSDLFELQRRLAGTNTLAVVESIHGHDAFLKEHAQLAPLLRAAIGFDAGISP